MAFRTSARAAHTAKAAKARKRTRKPTKPERDENDPPADQLERWHRLEYLWPGKQPGDKQMNDALRTAGMELRKRRNAITVEDDITGIAWKAVAGLVLDNRDEDSIGIRYGSVRLTKGGHPRLLNERARKEVALHMVRIGLQILAKHYGIIPSRK